MGQREQWGSRIGFIFAAAGSAIGLGNVWKFPYLVGMNGGAAFVLVYIILAIVVGSTVLMAELTIGRATKKNPVGAFRALSSNPLWQLVGWVGMLAGGFVILSYYGVVGGWTIKYMVGSLTGLMDLAVEGKSGDAFGAFIGQPWQVVFYQVIFMAVTMFIVAGGIGKGIERACKVMMPLLFVILIILIVRSVTLPGAEKGLEFYLKPDFSKLNATAFLAALGQMFFSLSLGMGIMITYGSYLSKDEHIPTCSAWIIVTDTAVALMAGLAIFPAVFAMGVEPGAGVGLTFVTLPGVFAKMPAGMFFSFLFFLLLFFAAVTSSMSLLEVATTYAKDEHNWSRSKAVWILGILITLLGVPSSFSLSGPPKIAGTDFFDMMGFLSDNIMMPLAAAFACLFLGWVWLDKARREITNEGSYSFKFIEAWTWSARIIAPVAILWIFYIGLKDSEIFARILELF